MKKTSIFLVLLMLMATASHAQFLRFGIKGGVNYSTLKFDDVKDIASSASSYNLQSDESFQGFHIGVMSRIKIFSAYLQPELYFNTAGGKVLIEEMSGGATVESVRQITYNKVDLPVMVGFKVGPLRLNAGPVATVVLSENNELEDLIPELDALSKSATIGYQAGFGVDILKFLTLDYRFEGSLSKYGDALSVGNTSYPFDSRANIHLISLGILF